MVLRDDLEKWLNDYLNSAGTADYAPNGLQIEGRDEIETVVTAVSINLEVIRSAVRKKADAILVHHGMFWKNEDPVIRGYKKERVRAILSNNISLFAYHLPLDFHPEIAHNRLILEGIRADTIDPPEGEDRSLGLIGTYENPVELDELLRRVEESLGTEARCYRFGPRRVKSLYVVSGGGKIEIERAVGLGVDAFLTGDARESTPAVARETGLNYIFAGHYNTERPGIIRLGKKIEERFGISVVFVDVENDL